MKLVSLKPDRGHLRVGKGHAAGIADPIDSDRTRRPERLCVEPIKLTIAARFTSGVPRQFMAMCENSRCSIRFYLLVPGGK